MHWIPMTVLLILLVVAVLTDWRSHRIPNALSLGGIVLGLTLSVVFGGIEGLTNSLLGATTGLLLLLPFYLLGGMSAGDTKLMACVGAFANPPFVFVAAIGTMLAGLPLAVGYAIFASTNKKRVHGYWAIFKYYALNFQPAELASAAQGVRKVRFPYASAIFVGVIAALWWFHSPIG